MKSLFKKTLALLSIMGVMVVLLSAFSKPFGGDAFEIYLSNKLIVQQYVAMEKSVKTVSLVEGNYNDQLQVVYTHCGVIGKNRSIYLRNGSNATVKKWQFEDASGNSKRMTCKVKDIIDLQKSVGNNFKLYYSSRELPEGKLLANIVIERNTRSGR